ncbi:DUF2793 domain-containing protein [Govanella unica]|uniref:DUF2793 domain-containing protein n=1 Tax=Govanella unica TaxID=2975056 RepID=A0A9X3Z8I4_9PROT|nr:DUF2793 domain-containing protein [Govania unica]MDA5194959.1 DUF2793 domain-containing protein [Govania unica]
MSEDTPRLKLPYIRANQAQKEVTHNSALNMVDAMVMAVVEDRDLVAPPLSPGEGQMWIVAAGATGVWSGQSGKLAHFIGGAWVFYVVPDGARVWIRDEQLEARMTGSGWVAGDLRGTALRVNGTQVVGVRAGAIAAVSGGTTVDSEARAALNALLAACRGHGLIAP